MISVLPYGNGLVNKTFLVTTTKQKYIIQEINKTVFKNPHLVMHNIDLITNHLRNKGNERSLKIIKTKTGRNYLFLKGNIIVVIIISKVQYVLIRQLILINFIKWEKL